MGVAQSLHPCLRCPAVQNNAQGWWCFQGQLEMDLPQGPSVLLPLILTSPGTDLPGLLPVVPSTAGLALAIRRSLLGIIVILASVGLRVGVCPFKGLHGLVVLYKHFTVLLGSLVAPAASVWLQAGSTMVTCFRLLLISPCGVLPILRVLELAPPGLEVV